MRVIHDEEVHCAAWAGDFFDREHLMPGGAKLDAAQFLATDGVTVTTTSSAAADATSIAVSALAGALPSGTMLYFGEAKEFAMLTAAAAAGATSITVQALPAAIESGDSATYAGTTGIKRVVSGTAIGRTYTERDAGTGYGPAAAADDEIYLLAFDVSACQMSTNSSQSVTWRTSGGTNSFAAANTTNFDAFGYGTGTRIASAWLTGITSTRVDIRG